METARCPVCDWQIQEAIDVCPTCGWTLRGKAVLGQLTRDAIQEDRLLLDQARRRRMERAMSNPNYVSDLQVLDDKWDLSLVVRPETVIITIGTHPIAELLDRPVAEFLRDAIDARGHVGSGRRAVIL